MKQKFHISVFGILSDKKGRVLFSLRRDRPIWNLPGGHMEAGESIDQTLVREFEEESGLDVNLREIVGIYSHRTLPELTVIFSVEAVGGVLRKSDEAKKHRYFYLEDIPENVNPRHRGRVKDFFKKPNRLFLKIQSEASIPYLLKRLSKKDYTL